MFNYIAIYKAAENGDFDALKEPGKDYSGLNLNYLPSDDFSKTSLAHYLLHYQQIELFKNLVIQGANLNLKAPIHLENGEGQISLAYLIAFLHPALVTFLISQNFRFDLFEKPKTEQNHGPIFHLLIQAKQYDAIDFNQPITQDSINSRTITPACWLAIDEHWNILSQLVHKGVKLDLTAKIRWKGDTYDQLTLGWILIAKEKWDLLQAILEKHPGTSIDLNNSSINPNEDICGLTPAWMLAQHEQWNLLKTLSKKSTAPIELNRSYHGKSFIWRLAHSKQHDLLRDLSEKACESIYLNSASTNSSDITYGVTLAWLLCDYRQWDTLEKLIEIALEPIDLNSAPQNSTHTRYGITVAWLLAAHQQWNLLKALKEKSQEPINLNSFPMNSTHLNNGITMAWLLCDYQQWDTLEKLIEIALEPIDLNSAPQNSTHTHYGITVAWLLAAHQQWDLLKTLSEKSQEPINLNSFPMNSTHLDHGITMAWLLTTYQQWDLLKTLSEKSQKPINLNSIPIHLKNSHRGKSIAWLLMAANKIELLDELLGDRTDLDLNFAPTAPEDNSQGVSVAYGLYQQNQIEDLMRYAQQSTVSLNLNARPTNQDHPLYNFSLADLMIYSPNIVGLNTEEMYKFEERLETFKTIIEDENKITLNLNEPNRNGLTIAWQLARYWVDVALNEAIQNNLKEDIQLECRSILDLFNSRGVCFNLDAFDPLQPGTTLAWLLASTPEGVELLDSNLQKQSEYKLNLDTSPEDPENVNCGDTLGFRLLCNNNSELFIKHFTTEMRVLKLAPTHPDHIAYLNNPVECLLTHNPSTLAALIKNSPFHFTAVYDPNEIITVENHPYRGWSIALKMAYNQQWDLLNSLNDLSTEQECTLDPNQTIKDGIMRGVSLAWLLVLHHQDELLNKIALKTKEPIDLNSKPESDRYENYYGVTLAMLCAKSNRFEELMNYGDIATLDLNASAGNKKSKYYGYTLAGLISSAEEQNKFETENIKFLSLQEVLAKKFPQENLSQFQYSQSLEEQGYSTYIDSLREGNNEKVTIWLNSELNLLQVEHYHRLISQTIIQIRVDLEASVKPVEKDEGSRLELSTENIDYNDKRMSEDSDDNLIFEFDPRLEEEIIDSLHKIKKYSSELLQKCRTTSQTSKGYPMVQEIKAQHFMELRGYLEFIQSFVMSEDNDNNLIFEFDPRLEEEIIDSLHKIKKYSSELLQKCRTTSQTFKGYPMVQELKAQHFMELRSFLEFLQSFVKINVPKKTSEQSSISFIEKLAKEFENSIEDILKNEPSSHWYPLLDLNQRLQILMITAFGHAGNTETIIPLMHQMLHSAQQKTATKTQKPSATEKQQVMIVAAPSVHRSPEKENLSPNKIYSPNKDPSFFGKSDSRTILESPNGKSPKRCMPENKLENDGTPRKRVKRRLFPPMDALSLSVKPSP